MLTRLEAVRAAHDEQLRTADVAQRFGVALQQLAGCPGASPTVDPQTLTRQRSQLLREGASCSPRWATSPT